VPSLSNRVTGSVLRHPTGQTMTLARACVLVGAVFLAWDRTACGFGFLGPLARPPARARGPIVTYSQSSAASGPYKPATAASELWEAVMYQGPSPPGGEVQNREVCGGSEGRGDKKGFRLLG
jgi:hypothetical protein